jgi:hypothetical protein
MTLEVQFDQAMENVYEVAKDHGYFPSDFKKMLDKRGGVETARRLLSARKVQAGLMRLWELKLLDYSVEALVLQERFRPLFTAAEQEEAHLRLEELDYFK